MKFQVRGPEPLLSPALRDHVERRLGLALGRFADRIGVVNVRLSQRGDRVHCQVEVTLRPRMVSVEDEDTDPARAAEFAIGRVDGRVALAIEGEQPA
jgi:ribosome-associated translation inhibitor RaiA